MIKLTRLNGKEFVLNVDYLEFVEATPDTIISTTTGKKLVVKDSVDDVIQKVIEFKKRVRFIDTLE